MAPKTLNSILQAAPGLTVRSFYKTEVRVPESISPKLFTKPSDGFTEDELANALDPLHRVWNPERKYHELSISNLTSGLDAVEFCGRVVNLTTFFGTTNNQPKASGWHHLILKDDSAAISIKLYFARSSYPLKLGNLVTCWTAFVSENASTSTDLSQTCRISANIFPGRVTSDHIMIHTHKEVEGLCRSPLDYTRGQPLPGLMTLESYIRSGHDGVAGAKLLVCVKSRRAPKKIQLKDGGRESELMDVILMDHTAETKMTVWNGLIESAKLWEAGKTILLISNPGYRVGYGVVTILRHTMIDIDPECPDAEWLRIWVEEKTKKEATVLSFPEGVWDVNAAEYGLVRMLFTLAELDDW